MNNVLNVGFLAHVDAGKTTITENLLYLTGATRKIGRVDEGTSVSDYLEVERRRGISVKASSVSLVSGGRTVQIIDTPGHADFLSEVERSLSALDLAVLILSSVEGVQPQTRVLLSALLESGLPFAVFLNKTDRLGADANRVRKTLRRFIPQERGMLSYTLQKEEGSMGEVEENPCFLDDAATELSTFNEGILEEYLMGSLSEEELRKALKSAEEEGKIIPVFSGSAKTGEGMKELLNFLTEFPLPKREEDLCGVIYKLENDKMLGAVAHVRLFGGELHPRDSVFLPASEKWVKTTQLKKIQGGKLSDVPIAEGGDLVAICGLEEGKAGDFIGRELPKRKKKLSSPHFWVRVECEPQLKSELLKAMRLLEREDPSLELEWVAEKKELTIRTTGQVHLETLKEILFDRFQLEVAFSRPSVIYQETPKSEGFGFECYTMPKPCWAVLRLHFLPLERGSGVQVESVADPKDIPYKYQEHVKRSVLETCVKQGLRGWEVTDVKVTLVWGEYHNEHTHPLDFFVATPMAFMDGLKNTGVKLLEPYLETNFFVEPSRANAITQLISEKRGVLLSVETDGALTQLSAKIPEGETFTLRDEFLSLTSGKGTYTSRFLGYEEVPEGMGCDRERIGVNPLDRAKWILHARKAL